MSRAREPVVRREVDAPCRPARSTTARRPRSRAITSSPSTGDPPRQRPAPDQPGEHERREAVASAFASIHGEPKATIARAPRPCRRHIDEQSAGPAAPGQHEAEQRRRRPRPRSGRTWRSMLVRLEAEVAGRPDPEELQPVERFDQVARGRCSLRQGAGVGAAGTASPSAAIGSATHSAGEARNATARGEPRRPRRAGEPGRAAGISSGASQTTPPKLSIASIAALATASGRTARARPHSAAAEPATAPSRASSPGGRDLLDSAPERVAEQQRRLARDERRRARAAGASGGRGVTSA